jgi:hypothetical protein
MWALAPLPKDQQGLATWPLPPCCRSRKNLPPVFVRRLLRTSRYSPGRLTWDKITLLTAGQHGPWRHFEKTRNDLRLGHLHIVVTLRKTCHLRLHAFYCEHLQIHLAGWLEMKTHCSQLVDLGLGAMSARQARTCNFAVLPM